MPPLFHKVVVSAVCGISLEVIGKMAGSSFVASGAWTDAALTLIELELPNWKFGASFEDGEWLVRCRGSQMPVELEPRRGRPSALPLAILRAFVARAA